MTWRADFANNLADGYKADGTMEPHDDRSSASAAGSMDTTIEDQSLLWSAILRGEGLTKKGLAELKRPQFAIASKLNFQRSPRTCRQKTSRFSFQPALDG